MSIKYHRDVPKFVYMLIINSLKILVFIKYTTVFVKLTYSLEAFYH